jgi:hypothetical protein
MFFRIFEFMTYITNGVELSATIPLLSIRPGSDDHKRQAAHLATHETLMSF